MDSKKITYICIGIAIVIIILIFTNFNYSQEPIIEDPYIDNNQTKRVIDNDFMPNEVIIGLKDNTYDLDIDNYLYSLPAVIHYESLIDDNTYVLTIDHNFNSRRDLNNYCNSIKDKYIEYCEANNIIKLDDCSKGPC